MSNETNSKPMTDASIEEKKAKSDAKADAILELLKQKQALAKMEYEARTGRVLL